METSFACVIGRLEIATTPRRDGMLGREAESRLGVTNWGETPKPYHGETFHNQPTQPNLKQSVGL